VLSEIKNSTYMKIFISWSGELSKQIAEIFKNWLPKVIQAAKPFYSPHDIGKGSRWNYDIAKELDSTSVGLICLTQDNLESPWIMFEAGALSKNVDNSKVCPILFNVEPSQIIGPLTQFQATTKFSKEEIYKTLIMLNEELGENKLKSSDLQDQFEMWWPKLKESVENALRNVKLTSTTEKRSSDDILEEILQLTRSININSERKDRRVFSPRAFEDLVDIYEDLMAVSLDLNNETLLLKLKRLYIPFHHLIKRSTLPSNSRDELLSKLENHLSNITSALSDIRSSSPYLETDSDKLNSE